MILDFLVGNSYVGYVAGTLDGIVTVGGVPARRDLVVFNAENLDVLVRSYSLDNGQYFVGNLDPDKRYLLMCRDLPPDGITQRYEPFCWDYVTPMTDLTLDEQRQLWQQMTEK